MRTNTQELVRHATAWQDVQLTSSRQAIVAALLDDIRIKISNAQTRVAFDDSRSDFERVLETFSARPVASVA